MKLFRYVFAVTAAVLIAGAAQAHDVTADRDAMHKRFQEMGRMMEQMPAARGDQRHTIAHDHMRLLRQQMSDMHGMMGGHGGIAMARPGSPGGAVPDRLGAMEERMDMMQQMMEHMLRQQDMMLENDDS